MKQPSNYVADKQHDYLRACERNENAPDGRKHQRQVEVYLAATECLKAEIDARIQH